MISGKYLGFANREHLQNSRICRSRLSAKFRICAIRSSENASYVVPALEMQIHVFTVILLCFHIFLDAFEAWKINDPPLDLDFYLFNWTNPQEIRNPHVKPHFDEVGPYRVKEVKEKTNLTWNDNNTITYMVKMKYTYIPDISPRKLDEDKINTINTVPLTVAYQARKYNYFTKRFISMSMSSISNLYVTKTAREILFDGYSDGILSVLSRFPGLNVREKFGIFYGRNYTIADEVLTMYTKNDENFGRQMAWNYKNHTNFYKGHCNQIKGSAAEFYPLNRKKTKLTFYSSELCKYAELEFDREEVIKGVVGYRYSADHIFDNGEKRPENACFCVEECIPSGVLDVSKCRQNSPIFLSFAHFYTADSYYTNLIDGMTPNKSKHEFYIVIEPNSGIIMDIAATMQLNMLLQPLSGFTLYQDVPKIYVPIFYFSQRLGLKDGLAANLRLIQSLPDFLNYTSITFIFLGLVLTIWSACSVLNVCILTEPATKKSIPTHFEEIPFTEKKGYT